MKFFISYICPCLYVKKDSLLRLMHGCHMELLEFAIKEEYTTLYCEHYILQGRQNCCDLHLDVFIVHDGTSFTVCCVGCICQMRKNFDGYDILEYMVKKSNLFDANWICTSLCFERLEKSVYNCNRFDKNTIGV